MAKKKHRVPKQGPVYYRSAIEATLDQMPKYNGHACGTGPHGDAKYNRAKQKRAWQQDLYRQEARTRGPLLLVQLAPGASCTSEAGPVTRFARTIEKYG